MSFEVKKTTFLMNSQNINQHNQSTVETNGNLEHVLQADECNKTHAHDGCGCGKDNVYLLDVVCPRQHNRGHIELVSEPSRTVRRPPKIKNTVYQYICQ